VDFTLSETQAAVRKTARDFARREVAPRAEAVDAGAFPVENLRGLGELGLLAINVPEEAGGQGAGPVACALAIGEIARACASTAVVMSVTNMVGETIARFGTETQKRAYLARLARGDAGVGSFALSEPDAGSDPGGLRTAARRDGGHYVLDGSKQWITGGTHAAVFIVWARTGATGTRGLTCFLVDAATAGLSIGAAADKMGIRGASTVPLTFEGCRVPAAMRLGSEGEGFKIAMTALDGGRIGIAAQALGIGCAALAESVSYAAQRETFGAPIATRQGVAFKLADMRVALDAAELLTMRAAWRKEKGMPFSREASMAKLVASEAAIRVCQDAVQIHGGYGYVREYRAERHFRDARVTTIYEGTSEIQRLVIARSVLASG
jgi:alkylation response protein AidB-like acyl-CoA dehydrogenase